MATRSRSSRKAQPPRRPNRWKRVLGWTFGIGLTVAILGLIALVIAVYTARSSLPSFDELKSSPNGQMIRVHAADGTILVSLGPSYGEWIPYAEIPAPMRDAMVAVEDRRFRSHIGVDPVGIARGIQVSFQRDKRVAGVSTITQQLARNVFLTSNRSYGRKLREGILALALERKFTKDQILELYLNKAYFGGGAYGVDAASRKFFGHPAQTLSTSESAIVAGLVKAPSNYSPTADADAAVARGRVVLRLMKQQGVASAAGVEESDIQAVKLAPEPMQNSVRYFTDWALPQLEMLIDETVEPIDVWTTLDLGMQRAADEAIRANAPAGAQGALVALDRGGEVRAMVGGKDYVSSIYNRATQATRQPGSAFKLFVYLAALEAGHKPDDQVVDEAVTINGWSPRNSSRRFSGAINIRTAFAYSINTIAAKLGQEIGFGTIADMARRFGITTPVNTHPSMVLGTSDVRLIDMTRAFASVAQEGVAVTPYGITRVTANNQVIYAHEVDTSRVLVAPYVAAEMTDLLQTAVSTGTARAAQIGRPVAGKTGTTSSNKDGWFLGFSSGITTGVWMGRDDARPISGLQGGTAPARAFASFMKRAVANRPIEQFETEVTLPEWQLEPDEETYFGEPDNGAMMVDADGNPVDQPAPTPQATEEQPDPVTGETPSETQRLDQEWLDRMTGRGTPPNRPPVSAQPPREPPPRDQDGERPYQ
ncbi:PBP1A family penicillin-binding protein [Sphingomonas donggukensis]|uniref:peptidoglycan glycosyltransferase n=1 Tax=Sphingomonas donggukensis TaxID=2949093 RepID=A0ABY4TVR5_9SPHN|nr:PBP1A family penicillin-binding protein [Sphingomonas donggukensis]URW75259.1 PBP1A family penicillin-binding protein [Sphingomonas donggukensis]